MSELTAATKTYRLERDAWERAYYELSGETEQMETRLKSQVADIRREIEAERSAWRKEVRRARGPGFGFFAGVGLVPGGFEPVVGAGVVWKL